MGVLESTKGENCTKGRLIRRDVRLRGGGKVDVGEGREGVTTFLGTGRQKRIPRRLLEDSGRGTEEKDYALKQESSRRQSRGAPEGKFCKLGRPRPCFESKKVALFVVEVPFPYDTNLQTKLGLRDGGK